MLLSHFITKHTNEHNNNTFLLNKSFTFIVSLYIYNIHVHLYISSQRSHAITNLWRWTHHHMVARSPEWQCLQLDCCLSWSACRSFSATHWFWRRCVLSRHPHWPPLDSRSTTAFQTGPTPSCYRFHRLTSSRRAANTLRSKVLATISCRGSRRNFWCFGNPSWFAEVPHPLAQICLGHCHGLTCCFGCWCWGFLLSLLMQVSSNVEKNVCISYDRLEVGLVCGTQAIGSIDLLVECWGCW